MPLHSVAAQLRSCWRLQAGLLPPQPPLRCCCHAGSGRGRYIEIPPEHDVLPTCLHDALLLQPNPA